MNIYGTVKTHKEQRDFRVSEFIKALAIFTGLIVLIVFLSWVFFDKNFIITGVSMMIVGSISIAMQHFKDLKKLSSDNVSFLLSSGSENATFINTIKCMLDKNGVLNKHDLKALLNEIYWENRKLKNEMDEAARNGVIDSQNENRISDIYIKFNSNEELMELIRSVLKIKK